MLSRKIDKINNLAGLPGDGGEVLVGGKYGNLRQKKNAGISGKWEFYGGMGSKVWIETWKDCWSATGPVRVTILTSFSRFN